MQITSASEFLGRFATLFENPQAAQWKWEADDEIFGKQISWKLGVSDAVDADACIDLTGSQLQLTITERAAAAAEAGMGGDTAIVFDALISFDDETVTLNGRTLPYEEGAIRDVIAAFNERT